MATDFSSQQEFLDRFNNTYNVNFSFLTFEMNVRRYQNISSNFVNMASDMNSRFYISSFSTMYREALTNFADGKISSFNSRKFIEDYQNLMDGYKTVINQTENKIQRWPKTSTILEQTKKDLSDSKKGIPDSKVDYIIKRYVAGKFPMRKMRANANELINSGCKDNSKLSVIYAYAKALEKVNNSRPSWWRVLNYFRNRAEQRDAQNLQNMLQEYVKASASQASNNAEASANKFNSDWNQICNFADDNAILDAKQDVNTIAEELDGNLIGNNQAVGGRESQDNSLKKTIAVNVNSEAKNELVQREKVFLKYKDFNSNDNKNASEMHVDTELIKHYVNTK